MRIVQESGVAGVQELQNEEVFSSASNLNFTSAPASSSWLLASLQRRDSVEGGLLWNFHVR
jgi:hypothetical protein